MIVQNTAELRSLNKKKIIEFLRFNPPATKKDIADQLDLSFATISNLCNQLLEEGILDIISSQNSSGGRIPGLLSIKPSCRYFLCLNVIGKNEIDTAVVNLNDEIVAVIKSDVPKTDDFRELIQFYYSLYSRLVQDYGISQDDVLGIGVAAPCILNKSNNCMVNSTNPIFENKPLCSEIEKIFRLPVSMENESNLLVLATSLCERRVSEKRDIIYLYLGEGLGSGILCNGQLVTGSIGLGGEISHIPLGIRSFECYCGNSGCIESELTAEGFLRKYSDATGHKIGDTRENWEEFVWKVLEGDNWAVSVVEENGMLLGRLISVLVGIFNPEAVYIGGITEKIFDVLYPPLMEETKRRIVVKGQNEFKIYNSENYDHLIFKGCAELVFKNWRP